MSDRHPLFRHLRLERRWNVLVRDVHDRTGRTWDLERIEE